MCESDDSTAATLEQARAAKAEALSVFQRIDPQAGIGIMRVGSGYGLKVNIVTAPASDVTVPNSIQNVPVRIKIVGPIRKRAAV